jgi:hypothetical protein
MNNGIYTDNQLIDLAKKEYEPNDIGDWVFIDGGKTFIGHVSEVNHKVWGEFTIRKLGGD